MQVITAPGAFVLPRERERQRLEGGAAAITADIVGHTSQYSPLLLLLVQLTRYELIHNSRFQNVRWQHALVEYKVVKCLLIKRTL